MKLKLRDSVYVKMTGVKIKELSKSESYKQASKEADKRIEENKHRNMEIQHEARNYIHDIDNLPRAKD